MKRKLWDETQEMNDTNENIPELLYRYRPLVVAKSYGFIPKSIIPTEEREIVANLFIDSINEKAVEILRFKRNISNGDINALAIPTALKDTLIQAHKPSAEDKSVVDEIENQEIHFSSIEELNDPLDGWQIEYFEGDDVLWENFLKNYLLNLMINSYLVFVTSDKKEFVLSKEIVHFHSKNAFIENNKGMSALYEEYEKLSFSNPSILALLNILIERKKMYKAELIMLFGLYRKILLNELNRAAQKLMGGPVFPFFSESSQETEKMEMILIGLKNNRALGMEDIVKSMSDDLFLSFQYYHRKDALLDKDFKKNISDFISNYPHCFINLFARSIHPEYGVVSFSKNNNNSCMWSHYADGHKGICLIFNTKQAILQMTNKANHPFYKVNYKEVPPEVNVFRNLGMFTMKEYDEGWSTSNGRRNIYFDGYGGEDFRNNYWKYYIERATYKSIEWQSEDECRLISNRLFLGDKVRKLQKYDFNMLNGIVFGLNTPFATKLEIINAIEKKCRENNRRDFVFYQAELIRNQSKMRIMKMETTSSILSA